MYPVLNETEARDGSLLPKIKTAGLERDAHHSKPAVKFCAGDREISHFIKSEAKTL